MDVFVKGKGKVTLAKSDFKAAGGEGAVYVQGKTAFKLYGQSDNNGRFVFEPKKVIPLGKIQELSALSDPAIIRPQDVLCDGSGTPIGYTMQAVPDVVALCQTFTKAFRDRNHLTPDHMLKLVQKVQAGVRHIHAQDILVVDMNETNFLVDTTFENVFFIDVDSYQTEHFPATAIMDSIRDRHSTTFSEKTDWFSFAIVSFQMMVGIHPYKGKHATFANMDARMLANVSVLNKDVKVPGACQSFDVIPAVYRAWYEAVLDRGERIAPPDSLTATVILTPKITHLATGSGALRIDTVATFDSAVVAICGRHVLTAGSVWSGTTRLEAVAPGSVLGVTPVSDVPVVGAIEQGTLCLTDTARRKRLDLVIAADAIMATGGRIYVRQGDRLLEITLTELPNRILTSAQLIGTVLGQATQLFEGVAVQNLLGATYLGLMPSTGRYHERRVPELDGHTVVDARFERGVLVAVVQDRSGIYHRFVLRFDDALENYDLRKTEDITLADVNFTVLDTGVVALLNENEELELFAKTRGASAVKIVADKALDGSCRLFSHSAQTLFARDATLHKMTMNKTP